MICITERSPGFLTLGTFPVGTIVEASMSWRSTANAAIEATKICGSLVAMILVGLPVFFLLAAIVTALLGVRP